MQVTQPNSVSALGVTLNSADVEKGLRELNKDIAFDVAVRRPGDWENILQFRDAQLLEMTRQSRLPVLYLEKYITGMDRGVIPEFKQWSVKQFMVEIPWHDADKEDASIHWHTISMLDPQYHDLYALAQLGSDPSLAIIAGGRLVRQRAMAYRKKKGRVIMLGWRHTFERLINANIPGITRDTLGTKFNVDLLKFPCGAPDEIRAELLEE